MSPSHVGVVLLHEAYAKVQTTAAVVAAHPSGNRNLLYTDGTTSNQLRCSLYVFWGSHIVTVFVSR